MYALSRRKLIYQALLLWYVVAVLHCFSYSLSTAPAIWWWCCCCSCCVLHFFFARASALTDRLIRRLSGVRSTVHNSYRLFINNMLDIFVCIAVTRLPVCLCCVSNVHLFCHTAFFYAGSSFPSGRCLFLIFWFVWDHLSAHYTICYNILAHDRKKSVDYCVVVAAAGWCIREKSFVSLNVLSVCVSGT